MSGIYIKGATLPENCHVCFAEFGGLCFVAPADLDDGNCPDIGRPKWCPLIQVKARGPLVDMEAVRISLYLWDAITMSGLRILNEFPVIIPAEEDDG